MANLSNSITCRKCGHSHNSISATRCEACGAKLGKSNETLALVLAGISVIALIGAGLFGYKVLVLDKTAPGVGLSAGQIGTSPGGAAGDVSTYLSQGEKVLLTETPNPDKQAAAAAFAAGDFGTAVASLESARRVVRNDPETLIYLNNARLGDTPALTVAAIAPIGSSASSAQELLRGVAQAQDDAIQAGIPLKVLIGDDNNDPDQAVRIANALVQNRDVIAVIGHGTSRTSLAAAPIYQQNGLVMIAPTSTSTELAQIPRETGNFIFRTIPSDQFTGTILARHMLTEGLTRAVVFYNSSSSYSTSLQEAFATTLSLEGGQVVQQIDLSQGNAAAQLAQTNADAIALFPDSETLPQAFDVAQVNQNRLPILAGDAFYRIESLREAGPDLNGAVLPVPWHPSRSQDPDFAAKGVSLWGGDINWRTALSYDALQVVREAGTAVTITPQSGPQGRLALSKALSDPSFSTSGVTGLITFLPSGDRNSGVVLVRVEPGTRSGTGFDFVPLE